MESDITTLMENPCLQLAQKASDVVMKEGQRMIKVDEENYVVVQDIAADDLPLSHYFSDGLYMREIFIPEGVCLVSRYHKFPTMNVVLSGSMSVIVDGNLIEVKAPAVFETPPGTKIGFATDDCRWLNVHGNPDNCRDIKELEQRVMDDSKSYTQEAQNMTNAFLEALAPLLTK